LKRKFIFCLLLQRLQSIAVLEEPNQTQMMLLLWEQELLVLALGCQRKHMLRPSLMPSQERPFHFITSYLAKRPCFVEQDLLRARSVDDILS
jgi:hypothetical protein